ncbi:MAG: 50S ribosomal protein L18 [Candidatus Taylorbacteria bacterium]|nr:50S ribosomal protein L18 [Candidatus Taylorbacteria bacterium]
MDKNKIKIEKRIRRHKRIRSRISGTALIPRFSAFKSNGYIYAQLINDEKAVTIVAASSLGIKASNKTEAARETGKAIAKKAVEQKIQKVVFDRGGYVYTGRIKAMADGAREGGLKF